MPYKSGMEAQNYIPRSQEMEPEDRSSRLALRRQETQAQTQRAIHSIGTRNGKILLSRQLNAKPQSIPSGLPALGQHPLGPGRSSSAHPREQLPPMVAQPCPPGCQARVLVLPPAPVLALAPQQAPLNAPPSHCCHGRI